MMDGSHSNPAINLHTEWMLSSNIVSLFRKYKVSTAFDHMTIDIDLNSFWVLQASMP